MLIGHNGNIIYRKAFGFRSLEPTRETMTADTIFDLASLTKCIATTTSVMQLIAQGRVRLNDPVAAYLPEFAQNGKQDITVRELTDPLFRLASGSGFEGSLVRPRRSIHNGNGNRSLVIRPARDFVYSDINFETLGFLVEKVSGSR